jgi:hypothetical protein
VLTSTFQIMDKQEENKRPFPPRTNIDWLQQAESKIDTYKERLEKYIDKSNGELDEFDFVVSEIDQCTFSSHENNRFTNNGIKWTVYKKKVMHYKEFLLDKVKAINEERNQSVKNQKANNYLKIFCIREFAPELKKKLDDLRHDKKLTKFEKQDIIHMLTGVNKTDSFDYNNKKDAYLKGFIDGEILDRVDKLKSKLI